LQLFKNQDVHIQQAIDENQELHRVLMGQAEELKALNAVLERTVTVKLEYEEVIK
jgi:hypothetical protein